MRFKQIMVRVLLLSLIVLLGSSSSCGYKPIEFDPKFYVGRHQHEYVINRSGEIISCQDEKFSQIACLTKEKIQELADILDNAVVPRDYKALKKEHVYYLKEVLRDMK